VLAWQLNAEFKYDPALVTEVEVRFLAQSEQATRVELEHRHLERLGASAQILHRAIDAPNGWSALLERFAQAASQ